MTANIIEVTLLVAAVGGGVLALASASAERFVVEDESGCGEFGVRRWRGPNCHVRVLPFDTAHKGGSCHQRTMHRPTLLPGIVGFWIRSKTRWTSSYDRWRIVGGQGYWPSGQPPSGHMCRRHPPHDPLLLFRPPSQQGLTRRLPGPR